MSTDDEIIPVSHVVPLGLMPDGTWLGFDEKNGRYARIIDPQQSDSQNATIAVAVAVVLMTIVRSMIPPIDDTALKLILLLVIPWGGLPIGWIFGKYTASRIRWTPYELPIENRQSSSRQIRKLLIRLAILDAIILLAGIPVALLFWVAGNAVFLLLISLLIVCIAIQLPTLNLGKRLQIARDLEEAQ